jgi:hypothetical protein
VRKLGGHICVILRDEAAERCRASGGVQYGAGDRLLPLQRRVA